ncbi:MAG: hypothetical protein MZV63_43540 [Marinilabiliales bacterium]|nr:hypothetical protein [Marinilabiliales bacterium]
MCLLGPTWFEGKSSGEIVGPDRVSRATTSWSRGAFADRCDPANQVPREM